MDRYHERLEQPDQSSRHNLTRQQFERQQRLRGDINDYNSSLGEYKSKLEDAKYVIGIIERLSSTDSEALSKALVVHTNEANELAARLDDNLIRKQITNESVSDDLEDFDCLCVDMSTFLEKADVTKRKLELHAEKEKNPYALSEQDWIQFEDIIDSLMKTDRDSIEYKEKESLINDYYNSIKEKNTMPSEQIMSNRQEQDNRSGITSSPEKKTSDSSDEESLDPNEQRIKELIEILDPREPTSWRRHELPTINKEDLDRINARLDSDTTNTRKLKEKNQKIDITDTLRNIGIVRANALNAYNHTLDMSRYKQDDPGENYPSW